MKFRLDPLSQSGISAVTTTVVTGGGSSSSGNSHDQVTLAGEDYLSLSGQQITANPIDLDNLSATGTPSGSTFLRGDNTWATPAGSGDVSKVGTPVNNQVGVWTGDGTIEGDTDLTFDATTNTLTTVNIAPSGTVDGRDIATDGTKLDGIEAGADVTDAVNVDAAGATMNSDTSLAGNGYFLDEDDMVSNSATKVPSQQSVKAYVDAQTSGAINSVVAGNNIDVDATDPANPVVSVETLNLADISDVTASASEVNVLDGIPGTLTATELGYVDGVTSAIQSQLDGKQPLDAELTAVAGLVDNGLIARTGAGAMASRTLTGTANKITVTNGDGSIGDPTITIPDTPTLVTPTIASFVNATHNHQNAAGGGQITDAALSSAVTVAKGGTGVTTLGSGNVLVGAGTSAVTTTKAAPTGDFVGTTDTQNITNKTFDSTSPTAFFYPGFIQAAGIRTAPSGWLLCDGSAVSRTTYSNLFSALCESIGTFTITIASPAVATLTTHSLQTGDQVYITTTGALPTGLSANTLYYAIRIDANTFNLATSRANAYAGTKVNTSGSQSGVHTLRWCPYGLGNGSTTFNVPDLRGRVLAGNGSMGGTDALRLTNPSTTLGGIYANIGASGGAETHQLTTAQLAAHVHGINYDPAIITASGASYGDAGRGSTDLGSSTRSAGSDVPHNNIQPTLITNWLIKT